MRSKPTYLKNYSFPLMLLEGTQVDIIVNGECHRGVTTVTGAFETTAALADAVIYLQGLLFDDPDDIVHYCMCTYSVERNTVLVTIHPRVGKGNCTMSLKDKVITVRPYKKEK